MVSEKKIPLYSGSRKKLHLLNRNYLFFKALIKFYEENKKIEKSLNFFCKSLPTLFYFQIKKIKFKKIKISKKIEMVKVDKKTTNLIILRNFDVIKK